MPRQRRIILAKQFASEGRHTSNKALHLVAIPLRFIAAGELSRHGKKE